MSTPKFAAVAGLAAVAAIVAVFAQTSEGPAFPGAEGFGARTPGGRGGRVIAVTSLDDSGPGTLREACNTKGPRIIVFRVSGIIDLKTPIVVDEPFATVAGQTAPGEGICLRGNEFKVRTHDVIVRFLRSRPGDISGNEVDAMGVMNGGRNVVFDHCSANWSVDECLSPSGDVANVTIQWCLIGEALNKSVHSKGAHGYGSLVRATGGLTLHHNLWLHNIARNPRLGDNYGRPPYPTFDVRNNVMYDWGGTASGLTGDELSTNYVNNYLRPGPSSSPRPPIVLAPTARVKYFVEGTVVEGHPEYSSDPAAMFTPAEAGGRKLFTLVQKPFETPAVTTTSAETAYEDVLAHVGAVCPSRDEVDRRLIREVRTRTGRIIDSQKDVGGWPVYRAAAPPKDSDTDGIPDDWETAHNLTPDDPKDGPVNIETYLNETAQRCIEDSRRASAPQTIKPGEIWPDDRGRHIQAHGGGILKLDDTYYWFGEERAQGLDPSRRYVSCYSSRDLAHWTFRNDVLKLADPENFGPGWVLERPKVFYNAKTRQYVMYMHIDGRTSEGNYKIARVGVAVSDSVDGDYRYLRSFRPLGHESRDIGQFVDDDGTAYLIFEDRPFGFRIARLSHDYLNVEKEMSLIPEHMEGGAIVHYDGLYYAIGSALTGWNPNPNKYATARSLEGPWSEFKDIAPPEAKTYGSQSTMMLKVVGTKATTVIFMGDIWKPRTQWDSRYLWMPLQIGGGNLWLPEPREWTLNVATGEAVIKSAN
jgi:hypothetical protein